MNNLYINNNEAFSSIILILFLKECKSITIDKFVLILPILLDSKLSKAIQDYTNNGDDNKTMIFKNSKVFTGFNKWFNNLLPITINCFHILNTLQYIELKNGLITYKDTLKSDTSEFDFSIERIDKIMDTIPCLVLLFEKMESNVLYNDLNIEL